MTIDSMTAQLILDALAWEVRQAYDDFAPEEIVETAREDFISFCAERGIDGVTAEVIMEPEDWDEAFEDEDEDEEDDEETNYEESFISLSDLFRVLADAIEEE